MSRRKGKARRQNPKNPGGGSGGDPGAGAGAAAGAKTNDEAAAAEVAAAPGRGRRARARGCLLVAAFGLQAGLIGLFYSFSVAYSPPPRLLASDATSAGGEVIIEARLEQDLPNLLRSSLAGQDLSLVLFGDAGQERPAEYSFTARTDRDGVARFAVPSPREPGIYRLFVSKSGSELKDEAVLQVIPADGDIVLVTPGPALWTPDVSVDVPGAPLDGAGTLLGRLAAKHAVVYVKFGRLPRPDRVRAWLRANGLPQGAIVMLPALSDTPTSRARAEAIVAASRALRTRLAPWLQERKDGVRWAFAADDGEALAFASCGIGVVQIGSTLRSPFRSRGVRTAADWRAAAELVEP